jgi:hypothetical protein
MAVVTLCVLRATNLTAMGADKPTAEPAVAREKFTTASNTQTPDVSLAKDLSMRVRCCALGLKTVFSNQKNRT